MSWKKYLVSVLAFSGFGLLVLFLLQVFQKFLPFNPQHIEGMSWDLSLNTAISFVTNTNWQAYSGESQLSYLSQALGLTVQNFVTPATGIAVLYALIRGFTRVKGKGVGNFWTDLTRSTLYVLMPLSLAGALMIASQGVPQLSLIHILGSKDLIYQTVSYISANFKRKLSLEEMAKDLGVSKYVLSLSLIHI